jgi:alpha-galactosidase
MVRLAGLDAGRRYRVVETDEVYGGDELMRVGLCCPLPYGDAASLVYTLVAED